MFKMWMLYPNWYKIQKYAPYMHMRIFRNIQKYGVVIIITVISIDSVVMQAQVNLGIYFNSSPIFFFSRCSFRNLYLSFGVYHNRT